MPDLGNLSLSETLALSHSHHCPNVAEPPDLTSSLRSAPLKTLTPPPDRVVLTRSVAREDDIRSRKADDGSEIKVPAAKAANCNGKGFEDRLRECSQKRNRMGSEDPKLEFSLPFLVGAPRMV